MKWIRPVTAFSNKKSIHRALLRLVLIACFGALFLITYIGVLDPAPSRSEPRTDKDLTRFIIGLKLPTPAAPSANSRDLRLAQFGKKLFFDTRLSANGSVACANCHQPGRSYTDGLPVSRGVGTTSRNAPTILNSHLANWFFWDGRADSLAAQAIGPLEHPDEHGLTRRSLAALIKQHHETDYLALFGAWPDLAQQTSNRKSESSTDSDSNISASRGSKPVAAYLLGTIGSFGALTNILAEASRNKTQPTSIVAEVMTVKTRTSPTDTENTIIVANIATAIEAWEKMQLANSSPLDRFIDAVAEEPSRPLNETAARSGYPDNALRGLRVFTGPGHCSLCHNGPLLSDQQFHNIGLGDSSRLTDLENRRITDWISDVAGRAKGLAEVKDSDWNCNSRIWSIANSDREARKESESCRQLEFLNDENLENVGAFKTPTLRNVSETAPYFHDGRAQTLDEVLDHYNRLSETPIVGHREESLMRLNLSRAERDDLKAFLNSLTSPILDLSELSDDQD